MCKPMRTNENKARITSIKSYSSSKCQFEQGVRQLLRSCEHLQMLQTSPSSSSCRVDWDKLAAGSHLERERKRELARGGHYFYLYFASRRRADRSVCSVQLAEGDYNLRRITITAIRHGGRITTIINTHNCRGSGHCRLPTVVSATPSFLSVAFLATRFLEEPQFPECF